MEQGKSKRTVIYSRLSSHVGDTKDPWASLDRQIEACRELARRQGFEVVEVIREVKSGAKDREGYNQALAMAKAGEVDAILACHFDRLTRDERIGSFEQTKADLRKAGCELYTYDQGKIPLDGSATSELTTDVQAATSKHYRLLFREKSMAGKLGKGKAGGYNGHPIPFAYDAQYHPLTGKLAFTINEEKAAIVRRIFHDFARGETMSAITAKLNQEGVPAPSGDHWYYTTIKNILHNPNLAGLQQFRRTVTEAPCELVPSREFPAIIDRETWEMVQMMHKVKQARGGGARGQRAMHPLSGLLRCEGCGRGLVLDRKNGHGYYRCADNITTRKERCPAPVHLRKDYAEQAVIDFLKAELPRFVNEDTRTEVRGRHKGAPKASATERLRKRIAQVEGKIAKLIDWDLDDRYPASVIENKRLEFQRELDGLRLELNGHEGTAASQSASRAMRETYRPLLDRLERTERTSPWLREYFEVLVATVKIVNDAPPRRPQKLRVTALQLTNGYRFSVGE